MLFTLFHKQTNNNRSHPKEKVVVTQRAAPYKLYERFPRVALGHTKLDNTLLSEVLDSRVSSRAFAAAKQISATDIALLSLSAMNEKSRTQVTEVTPPRRRNAPSGGGLYPLELYWAIRNVEGIESGMYHYNLSEHSLEKIGGEVEIQAFAESFIQEWTAEAQAWAVFTAVWDRVIPHYGEYTYRNTLLEAGHVAQNMLLSATAQKIGACPVVGFFNEEVDEVLNITLDNEDSLYIVALGKV
jgi:SagB-type dehydrogenase family enzyme